MLVGFVFALFTSTISFAQLTVSSSMTSEITVNGSSGTYEIFITNTSDSVINDMSIDVNIPSGINYNTGSLSNNSGHNIAEENTSNLTFNLPTLGVDEEASFSINLNASCSAINYQEGGGVFRNTIDLDLGATSLNHTSNPYNILYAALSIISINPKNTTITSGTQTSRTIRIINGGNGSVNNFNILHTHSSEISLINTSHGVLSGDEIVLGSSDFNSIGNGDGYLDQDEVIELVITYEGTSCTDKTISSKIDAGWNGDAGFCQNSTTYANTSIDFSEPSVSLTTSEEFVTCFTNTTAHRQSITLTNNGSGVASLLEVDVFKSSGSAYDQELLSKFDISSVSYNINSGVENAITPSSSSTTQTSGAYSCLGVNAIGQFILQFNQLNPGDVLNISWDMYICCSSECAAPSLGGWKTAITYTDVCAATNYQGNAVGQTPKVASMTLFSESEPQISNGDRELFTYVISSYDNSFDVNSDSRLEVIFNIPAGLKLSTIADIEWVSAPSQWILADYNYSEATGELNLLYALPEPFAIPKSEINLYLTADCSMPGATEGSKNIRMSVNFIQDINCSGACVIPLVCDFNTTTLLHCPDGTCSDGGIRNTSYSINRTSFGSPDNDENGYADSQGSTLDFSKIKTNRAMYGDTITATANGVVHSGSGITQWSKGYYELYFPNGINTSAINGVVTVTDASTGQTLSASTSTITRTLSGSNATYRVNISPPTLGGEFSNYVFEDGDNVSIVLNLKVTTNIGGNIQEETTSSKLYLSTVDDPTGNERYYCTEFLDNITLIGYFYNVSWKQNFTVTSCTKTIQQDFFLSIGDCCSNYNGGNLFPYEYRNWSEVATAKVVIPIHYRITSINLKQFYTRGTNNSRTQTVSNISHDYRNYDTLIFDLSQYYTTEGGTLHPSDDGYRGRLEITVSPSCDIPINTYQNIFWAFNFNDNEYLTNTTTDWYQYSSQDRIRYNPSKIALSSTNPIEDGLGKTVTWNLKVKNPFSNQQITNPWLHLISPTNDVQIKYVIDNATNDTLLISNDLYQLAQLNNRESQNFDIVATYTSCAPENLIAYSGYACDNIPTTYADVVCPHNNKTLEVHPKPAQLQVQISGVTVGDECSSLVEVELLMASVRLGAVDSLNLIIGVPATQSILNSNGQNQFAYPNTEGYSSTNDLSLVSNQYQFPLYSLDQYVNDNGLPGVTNVGANKMSVKMQFEMQPNFVPGEFLSFSIESKNSCNTDLPTINLAFDPNIAFEEAEITGLTTESGDNWSASWGDYNNDGFDDIFITEYQTGQPNSLFTNNGDLTFTKVTTGAIVTDLASSVTSSWADYNNDGYLDLFVANNIGSPNFLYKNNGNGTFTKITEGHIVNYDGYSHGSTWADYNQDGYLDLFVSDFMPTRVNLLYKNNGNGTFEQITSGDITSVSGHSIGASWSDADGDGDPDLFVPNAGEANFYYINNGGVLELQPSSLISTPSSYSTGGSWADFDRDGDMDLFVANASSNSNQLLINNGSGVFSESQSIISNATSNTHGSTWADFDNDGDLDLFVSNDQLEANEFYTNNGDGTFTVLATDLTKDLENSFGASVADIENDGDLDLFITNHSSEENVLFLNSKGACQNSYCATLVGTNSNSTSIGAKVFGTATIYGSSVTQMVEISAQTGGGAGGQNSMKIHFGLGDATNFDELRVEWPSGNVQYLSNQSSGECVILYETGGSLVSGVAYLDTDSDCNQDPGEVVLANQTIKITPLGRSVFTDENGYYSTYLVDGNYTLNGVSKSNFSSTCSAIPLNISGNGTSTYPNNDFGFNPSCTDPDLGMSMAVAALRRGFADDLFIEIRNTGGTSASDVEFKLVIPAGMEVNRASIDWDFEDTDTLIWEFSSIAPEEVITFMVRDSVTTELLVNDIIEHFAFISSSNDSDCNLLNNTLVYPQTIVGAIDPNDKLVEYSDGITKDYVVMKEAVNYKIRFQNVGTYYASRVVIIDTIDSKFDISSLHNQVGSHPFTYNISGNVITWVFDNIKLPAEMNDEEGSNGFIRFALFLKPEVELNDKVFNQAHIQFDFEDYIITNKVEKNVLENHPKTSGNPATIYISPNPVKSSTTISLYGFETKEGVEGKHLIYFNKIELMDIKGTVVKSVDTNYSLQQSINIANLAAGIYIIFVTDALGNVHNEKLIKY